MDRLDHFKEALKARDEEIANYQLDIDNFKLALEKLDSTYADRPSADAFRKQLQALLESNTAEQLKAIIMRDVLIDRIAEQEAP